MSDPRGMCKVCGRITHGRICGKCVEWSINYAISMTVARMTLMISRAFAAVTYDRLPRED